MVSFFNGGMQKNDSNSTMQEKATLIDKRERERGIYKCKKVTKRVLQSRQWLRRYTDRSPGPTIIKPRGGLNQIGLFLIVNHMQQTDKLMAWPTLDNFPQAV